jgi:uncharacterized membrane protein
MSPRPVSVVACCLAALVGCQAPPASEFATEPTPMRIYRVTNVQIIPGFEIAGASDDGEVLVGVTVPDQRAAFWKDGRIVELPPYGQFGDNAYDAGHAGAIIVGRSLNNIYQQTRAVVWIADRNGDFHPSLLPFDASHPAQVAHGVSDSGSYAVGFTIDDDPNPDVRMAAVWRRGDDGQYILERVFGRHARATAVSPDGAIVVGSSDTSAGERAKRWRDGDSPNLQPGSDYRGHRSSRANAISDDGQVVIGDGTAALGLHVATRWVGESTTGEPLGKNSQVEGCYATALSLTHRGDIIVGYEAEDPRYEESARATIWTEWPRNGRHMSWLSDFLLTDCQADPALFDGLELLTAIDIRHDGRRIAGNGRHHGQPATWRITLVRLE